MRTEWFAEERRESAMSEVVSYLETYRQGAEVIYPIPALGKAGEYTNGDMIVAIAAMGGGTLGKRYRDTHWIAEIHHESKLILSTIIYPEHSVPHLEAAWKLADRLVEDDEWKEVGERLMYWAENFTTY